MSRREKEDSCNVICPYCNAMYQASAEDVNEEPELEQCDRCGESYKKWAEIDITYHTEAIK